MAVLSHVLVGKLKVNKKIYLKTSQSIENTMSKI